MRNPNNAYRLPKEARLKSRTIIDMLFSKGRSLFVFPIKLVYLALDEESEGGDGQFLFGVSVPKRIHKKAHVRNLLKRRIREAYRQNKITVDPQNPSATRYALMYLLVDKDVTEYAIIERSIKRLHKKMADLISKGNDD